MSALLEARGVARRYGDEDALRRVDAAVRRGEILAVLGPSGSGKSTLLRLLHLLEAPTAGEVRIDGAPAPGSGPARLAAIRRMGLVQQRPGLLRATARENVAFPLRARGVPRAERRRVADEWLARLGLARLADAPAWRLSGGEAQRVALARALAPRPDALLLDEATNQLDPEATRAVEDVLRAERARGCAVALVTHGPAQARRLADRYLFLERGVVAAEGRADDLAAPADARLRAFVEMG